MKKVLLSVLFLAAYIFAAGGAKPTATVVDAVWGQEVVKEWSIGGYAVNDTDGNYIGGSDAGIDSLDTLDGADSLLLYSDFSKNAQYILTVGALSGDSSANAVCEVILRAYTSKDSLLFRSVVDTLAAAGTQGILIPHKRTVFGAKYELWVNSKNANDEVKIKWAALINRWPIHYPVRKQFKE